MVIKSEKRRRLFTILLEIIIGIGIYAFIFYSDLILGEKIEYTWEILLGYIVVVFFFEIISTISVFNKFDIQARKNHQNINFLLGADIAEGLNGVDDLEVEEAVFLRFTSVTAFWARDEDFLSAITYLLML